jgi:hypothetical protein
VDQLLNDDVIREQTLASFDFELVPYQYLSYGAVYSSRVVSKSKIDNLTTHASIPVVRMANLMMTGQKQR